MIISPTILSGGLLLFDKYVQDVSFMGAFYDARLLFLSLICSKIVSGVLDTKLIDIYGS